MGRRREGDIVFINKNVEGEWGCGVCATALAKRVSLSGWGRRGKRTGYFLLSSSGSGRRKGRVEAGGGRGRVPPRLQAPTPCRLTWRVAQQPPYPPVSPDPTPNHCSPSGRQRSAQPAQRSAAQQTVCPEARAVRARRVRAAAYPCLEAQQWQCASAVTSEATRGGEGSGGGTAAGGKDKKGGDTCDTVQRDGGGGTGYPMAREDRETAVIGGGWVWRA